MGLCLLVSILTFTSSILIKWIKLKYQLESEMWYQTKLKMKERSPIDVHHKLRQRTIESTWSDTHNRSVSHASYITPVVHKDCYKYVTMKSIIDVDIYQWCKSYRKTSLSKSRTSRFRGYIDLRYRSRCNRHINTEGARTNVPSRETGNIWYTKEKTTRTHMCWTQLYAHKHKYPK